MMHFPEMILPHISYSAWNLMIIWLRVRKKPDSACTISPPLDDCLKHIPEACISTSHTAIVELMQVLPNLKRASRLVYFKILLPPFQVKKSFPPVCTPRRWKAQRSRHPSLGVWHHVNMTQLSIVDPEAVNSVSQLCCPSFALVHSPLSMVCASSTVKVCFTTLAATWGRLPVGLVFEFASNLDKICHGYLGSLDYILFIHWNSNTYYGSHARNINIRTKCAYSWNSNSFEPCFEMMTLHSPKSSSKRF